MVDAQRLLFEIVVPNGLVVKNGQPIAFLPPLRWHIRLLEAFSAISAVGQPRRTFGAVVPPVRVFDGVYLRGLA